MIHIYVCLYLYVYEWYESLWVGDFRWRVKGRGRGRIFLENFWPMKSAISLILSSYWSRFKKKSQNNSPVHLSLTPHLKTPTLVAIHSQNNTEIRSQSILNAFSSYLCITYEENELEPMSLIDSLNLEWILIAGRFRIICTILRRLVLKA